MQINSKSYKLALLYPHLMASFLCKITVHGNLTLNLIKSIFLNFLKNSKICRIVKKYFSKNNNSKDIRAKGSIQFLEAADINFQRLKDFGIDHQTFAEYFISSGK